MPLGFGVDMIPSQPVFGEQENVVFAFCDCGGGGLRVAVILRLALWTNVLKADPPAVVRGSFFIRSVAPFFSIRFCLILAVYVKLLEFRLSGFVDCVVWRSEREWG